MLLYLETDDGFELWTGQVLPDPDTGAMIKLGGPPEDPEAWGLYEPAPADPVPDGKIVVSTHVERVDDVVKFVDELADAPVVFPVPTLYAVAELTIADGVIDGIPLNSRLSAALWFDVGLYYVFFAETQPDTNYLAKAYDGPNTDLRISEKSADYFVVQAWDANGDPTDPAAVSIEIIRVG